MQVHGIGGAAGVIWYALMAHKDFVTELYGTSLSASCTKAGMAGDGSSHRGPSVSLTMSKYNMPFLRLSTLDGCGSAAEG